MRLTCSQVAELIGVRQDTLRTVLGERPWQCPAPLPREHNQQRLYFEENVVREWLAKREAERVARKRPKLLWVGENPFDGAVSVAREQEESAAVTDIRRAYDELRDRHLALVQPREAA